MELAGHIVNCKDCGNSCVVPIINDSSIGSPKIKCNVCGKIISTKFYLYSQANWFGRIYFWFSKIVSINNLLFIILPVMYIIVLISMQLGLYEQDNPAETWQYLLVLMIMIFSLYSRTRHLLSLKKQIDWLEKTYKKNGGFLMGNENFESEQII